MTCTSQRVPRLCCVLDLVCQHLQTACQPRASLVLTVLSPTIVDGSALDLLGDRPTVISWPDMLPPPASSRACVALCDSQV
mmetsp:Transcript_16521/g.42399  ORF Transcript_16521/g.42399 Transcript_16521/m.42399 type:complete len:81 (-) Transcript_16521:727-969(-)